MSMHSWARKNCPGQPNLFGGGSSDHAERFPEDCYVATGTASIRAESVDQTSWSGFATRIGPSGMDDHHPGFHCGDHALQHVAVGRKASS